MAGRASARALEECLSPCRGFPPAVCRHRRAATGSPTGCPRRRSSPSKTPRCPAPARDSARLAACPALGGPPGSPGQSDCRCRRAAPPRCESGWARESLHWHSDHGRTRRTGQTEHGRAPPALRKASGSEPRSDPTRPARPREEERFDFSLSDNKAGSPRGLFVGRRNGWAARTGIAGIAGAQALVACVTTPHDQTLDNAFIFALNTRPVFLTRLVLESDL
jgi:hypothetical protein